MDRRAIVEAQVTNKTVIISTLLSHMRLIAFEPGLFIANVKFLQVVVHMTIEIVYVPHNARNYLVLVVHAWVFHKEFLSCRLVGWLVLPTSSI